MTHCTACSDFRNNDPDGLIVTCARTGQRCYIDDLGFGTMTRCPEKSSSFRANILIIVK
jgi:hypothetical protein